MMKRDIEKREGGCCQSNWFPFSRLTLEIPPSFMCREASSMRLNMVREAYSWGLGKSATATEKPPDSNIQEAYNKETEKINVGVETYNSGPLTVAKSPKVKSSQPVGVRGGYFQEGPYLMLFNICFE